MRRNTPRSSAEVSDVSGDSGREIDVESLVVAHYAVDLGMSYEQIQEMTGLSRATVARRLQHATNEGWIQKQLLLAVPDELADEYDAKTHDLGLQDALLTELERYGLRRVSVVSDKEVQEPGAHEVIRRIGHAAALRIAQSLAGRGDAVVGVNWGWSVYFTVEALAKLRRSNKKLRFVPLMGNFAVDESDTRAYNESQMCAANRLARLMAEAFGARQPRRLTTPAIIPRKFADDEKALATIWDFLKEDYSYLQVFGKDHHHPGRGAVDQNALINQMDTVITGMSALQPIATLISVSKLANASELKTLRNAGYAGDLGGHPIHDPLTEVTDQEAIGIAERIGRLVVAPKVADFQRIASKAREPGSDAPGVLMIGRGERKAMAFIAACRLGAVNELFTDRSTAQEMRSLLEKGAKSR